MNYTQIKAEIVDWMHRSDLDAKMDTFCILAESMIDHNLRCNSNQKRVQLTLNDAFTDLPVDFMEMRAIETPVDGARRPLRFCNPTVLDKTYSRAQGSPRAYTIQGGQLEVRPAPSIQNPVDIEVTYYARLPSLVSNGTNKVSQNIPLLYIAGMMVAANDYVQDNDEYAKWLQRFNTEIAKTNKAISDYHLPQVQIL